jgi:hypothetical protein
MDQSRYVDAIKNIISGKAKEHSIGNKLTPNYFKTLFPIIKESLKLIFTLYSYPELDDVTLEKYFEVAKNEYLSVNPIDIDPCNSLVRKGFKTWLTKERKDEMSDSWNYSNRYFTMLEKSGRSENVLNEIKDSSLEILEKIGDPKSKVEFYIKGLVVGEVQSGKTGNFNAVINRAIDSGYGLIIVLSGVMEDLRSQTQLRIENDVIGSGIIDLELETKGVKGVGLIRKFGSQVEGAKKVEQVVSVTSYKSDFNKSLADADFSIDFTNVLVCKKNVSVLRNLIVWLHDFLEENKGKHNIPLLILDDEADNASLNNEGKKGREYASKINGHIRALLALFKRKTYLGYTATPFANILADRNDFPEDSWVVKYKLRGQPFEKSLQREANLFPDDFIVSLNSPTNYIGAKQIFETIKPIENTIGLKIPLYETVDDNIEYFPDRVYVQHDGSLVGVEKINNKDDWNNKFGEYGTYLNFNNFNEYKKNTQSTKSTDNFPKSLPNSLKESILCFILAIAIRDSRKPNMMNSALFNPHNSMLIHISRYTKWQNNLKILIDSYLSKLQSSVDNDDPSNPNLIFSEFERIWYKYYEYIVNNISDYLPVNYEDMFLAPVSFETIKRFYLVDAISGIQVKAINSDTGDKLIYPKNNPQKVIAIGGNRLSRGFTLEGLSINYFVRSTNYYDALLQMGRWFGYRPGYLDCCKLFTSEDSIDKYNSVTRTIEELESEFKKMEEKDKTPENFILRIKKHPGALKITRPSILKDTIEVNWSYQDTLEQTTGFVLKKDKITKVWGDFKDKIVIDYGFSKGSHSGFFTSETNIQGIIDLLKLENNFGEVTRNSIIKFLELCKVKNKLSNWTIAIKTTGGANSKQGKGELAASESNLPDKLELSIRRGPSKTGGEVKYRDNFLNKNLFSPSGKSANLISSGSDLSILLSDSQRKKAKNEFVENKKKYFRKKYKELTEDQVTERAEKVTVPESVYREKMNDQQGLLVIYILDPYYVFLQEKDKLVDEDMKKMVEENGIDLNIPLIGYAIGFPPIVPDPGGVYIHGNYGIEEEEDDEEIDEEDSEIPTDFND